MRVAALDFGTNTCLLLIADVSNDGRIQQVIHDEAQVVRLGQGVAQTKRLHPEALERAEKTFRSYAKVISSANVERTLACATSAARDTTNRQELIDLAAKYKIPVEVISGEEEAELTFRGTFDETDGRPIAIIDVGGGSTEFIYGDASGIRNRTSIDIGAVRMTETFIAHHPVPQDELEKTRAFIAKQLRDLKTKIKVPENTRVIAVAGTPTTLAAVDQGRPFDSERVQGAILTNEKMKHWLKRFAEMTIDERRRLSGMDAKRADVIVAGTLILLMSSEALGATQLEVSIQGLRYGIAKKLAASQT